MPHYKRNVQLIFFIILPILGFLLGWSLSQKSSDGYRSNYLIEDTQDSKETPLFSLETTENRSSDTTPNTNADMTVFWETWNALRTNYLDTDKFSPETQVYGATKGLVDSLGDPYTVFMTPEEMVQFQESIEGDFTGIGAEVEKKDQDLIVVTPLKGSPAELSGILPKDIIYAIDGESTVDMNVVEAVTKIQGPKGENVVLTIVREGEENPIEINIVRDEIHVNSVEWELKKEGKIAVIEVSHFGTELDTEFQEAISEILLEEPEAIVLDLRNNPGGLLDKCIELATEFMDRQLIVQIQGKQIGTDRDYISGKNGAFKDMPLIVLVNEATASAAEILAGAIQDHNRGLVLGMKTYGKGLVQEVLPLSEGGSLKVTVAEWLTPDGNFINEYGITPDLEIERTQEDFDADIDTQLNKALSIFRSENEYTTMLEEQTQAQAEKSQTSDTTEE